MVSLGNLYIKCSGFFTRKQKEESIFCDNTEMEIIDLNYDLKEALYRTKFSMKQVENLRKILHANSPKNLTDKQLMLFLNACKGNLGEASNLIQKYFNLRKLTPEHFKNRDPQSDEIKQCLQNQAYFVIPPTSKENCPIVYHKVTTPQASQYFFDNAVKVYCMTMDVALNKYGPRPGIIFVHDMENVGFSHLLRASLSSIKKFLDYLQNALPATVCRIHVLNVIPLFHKILTIVKPFMNKGLLDVIYVHEPKMDYEEFYEKWIPKSQLPADYGGDLPSVKELNEQFAKELSKLREYFINEERQRL